MDFQGLICELQRQHELKVDYKASGMMVRDASDGPCISFARGEEVKDGKVVNEWNGGTILNEIGDGCHEQIADRLDVPRKFYNRILGDHPDLWQTTCNTLFAAQPEKKYLLRTMDDKARALLSDRYRVIDNLDVINCVGAELDRHQDKGLVFERADLTERQMFVSCRFNELKGRMRVGDDFFGGMLLKNSETGHSSTQVLPRIYRQVCSNGLVIEQQAVKAYHMGSGTLSDDANLYNALQQAVKGLFESFGEIAKKIEQSGNFQIPDAGVFLNNLVREYKLSEAQKDNLFIAFGAESELSLYGMVNAVTNAAQKEEKAENRYELEKLGGQLLYANQRTIERLATAEEVQA